MVANHRLNHPYILSPGCNHFHEEEAGVWHAIAGDKSGWLKGKSKEWSKNFASYCKVHPNEVDLDLLAAFTDKEHLIEISHDAIFDLLALEQLYGSSDYKEADIRLTSLQSRCVAALTDCAHGARCALVQTEHASSPCHD